MGRSVSSSNMPRMQLTKSCKPLVFAGYRYVEYLIDTRNQSLSQLKSGLLVVVGLLLVGQALLQFAARGRSLHTWWNKRQSTRQ